ncbi:MAG: hypothetical protein Q8930_18990 [Bacillota bacterium]|nr:hypothetical protein [Bacillota bacterium]
MTELIIEYVLIVLMVLSIAYFIYFLKEKGVIRNNDYYGITYTILSQLENHEANQINVKKILRAAAASVNFVESAYKDDDNKTKEEKALAMTKEAIRDMHIESEIGERSIRYLIRLACALGKGEFAKRDES